MSTETERSEKIARRIQFLEGASPITKVYQQPILDLMDSRGNLNPAGLGNGREFSEAPLGQSTVAFDLQSDFRTADEAGHSTLYGGAEYGIVQTPESELVTKKFTELHDGKGAVVLPSGLQAITTLFETFLKDPQGKPTILLPDNRYFPAERVLNHMRELNPALRVYHYTPRAGGAEIEKILDQVTHDGRQTNMIYLEAPGSQTFEIPALDEIISVAQSRGIRTAMDNTWGNHISKKPLLDGIDNVVQATTKYESGYADTPSGIIVSKSDADYQALARTIRATGAGAIDPPRCMRLFNRVASTEERMDRHYASALQVADHFRHQGFVQDILCPFLPESPDYERFQSYFKKGNGLLTVVFKPEISSPAIDRYLDRMNLFRTGESWGGHVSLALRAHPGRTLSELPKGEMVRFNMGLEDPADLVRDLVQAAPTLKMN